MDSPPVPACAPSRKSEQRRDSELEFTLMAGRVRDGMMLATLAGVKACEVWLGPKEAVILEAEMNGIRVEAQSKTVECGWDHLLRALRKNLAVPKRLIA